LLIPPPPPPATIKAFSNVVPDCRDTVPVAVVDVTLQVPAEIVLTGPIIPPLPAII
jgi:hypothetical protein